MPYKRTKDKANLVVQWKLKSSRKPFYFHVFLWKTQEAFDKNTLDNNPGEALGCANLAPDIICFNTVTKEETQIIRPKLGEIHFIKGKWNMEIVAHELMHAIIHRIRLMAKPTFEEIANQEGDSEEEICWEFGWWVDQIYRLLWDTDPFKKVRK